MKVLHKYCLTIQSHPINMYPSKPSIFFRLIHPARKIALLGLLIILSTACDFNVNNPGAIVDSQLNQPGSFEAVVNGMGRDLSEAINWISYTGAAVTRELHPAGATGSFGISVRWQRGLLDPDETSTHWDNAQQARWVAEHGITRFQEQMSADEFPSSPLVAQAYLWAGYANRLLGENMCQCVIDGGEAQDRKVFFERAEQHFTHALEIARTAGETDLVNAAIAGRASVRVPLADWKGAVADASEVPFDFEYVMPYYDVQESQYNRIYQASANSPYRAHTVWQTPYEAYYEEYQDPRTPWITNADYPYGDAAVGNLGNVPWYQQVKYDFPSSPITLSSGHEMLLIQAEAEMMAGDWVAGMDMINSLRDAVGVEQWNATNAEEAWAFLKRERGIELWLEARRMGDLKRWQENETPGALHPLEQAGNTVQQLPLDPNRDLCFPIPDSELDTNPNL